LAVSLFAVSEVQSAAGAWLSDYNESRPDESLGHVPPIALEPRQFNAKVSTSGCTDGYQLVASADFADHRS
jgi:hypothetical protein